MRDFILIGSAAINHYFPKNFRFPKSDIDILISEKSIQEKINTEIDLLNKEFGEYCFSQEPSMALLCAIENTIFFKQIPLELWHLKIDFHFFNETSKEIIKSSCELTDNSIYAHPSIVLEIKKNHFAWDIFWQKTNEDIFFLLKNNVSANFPWKKDLFKWHLDKHGKKWAKLGNKTEKEFFNDYVIRKYNHDDIHKAVAWYEAPLYTRFLIQENTVSCDKNKFFALSFEDQILAVKEEIIVTALERFLIPADFKYSYNLAYFRSFKKLCTTMSSGWFKEFVIDNYLLLFKNDDWSPIERFKQALSENKIREESYDRKK